MMVCTFSSFAYTLLWGVLMGAVLVAVAFHFFTRSRK